MSFCQPVRKVACNPYDALVGPLPFVVLGPDSPLSYRKAARLLAEDFANGAHFSPAPYEPREAETYGHRFLRDRVLLFGRPTGIHRIRFFGAAGVRWQQFDDIPEPGWFMTWAWFHPAEQRKGHLTSAWPHIVKLFPGVMPLPPLTDAMLAFLKKTHFDHPLFLHYISTPGRSGPPWS